MKKSMILFAMLANFAFVSNAVQALSLNHHKTFGAGTDSSVIHVAGLAQLMSYRGSFMTISVDTIWTGGIFVQKTGSVTADYGVNFPSAIAGTYWQRVLTPGAPYQLIWWSVRPDSSADNSTQIQKAINYVYSQKGGIISLIPGKYRGTNDTLKSGVFFDGYLTRGMTANKTSTIHVDTLNVVTWTATTSGVIINTPAAITGGTVTGPTCSMAGVNGITFYGLGSSVALIGIQLNATKNFTITNSNFKNISHSAIYEAPITAGVTSGTLYMNNDFVVNCLLDMSPYTTYEGAVELDGTDNRVSNCEIAGGFGPGGTVSSKGLRASIAFRGSDNFIDNVNAEFGDINWYFGPNTKGYRQIAVNLKSDQSFKEAMVIDGAQGLQLQGIIKSPGLLAPNTYSAVTVKNNAANVNLNFLYVNQISGSSAKYLLSDSTNITNGVTQKNTYNMVGDSTTYGTARYNILDAANFGGSLTGMNGNVKLYNTATPNVNGLSFISLTGGTMITNFVGGQTSQEVTVYLSTSTTISDNSAIVLISGMNTAFPANTILKFMNYRGVWYQEETNIPAPLPANSFNVNNTSAVALPGTAAYNYPAAQTYTGTPLWTGTTSPGGTLTANYHWTQIGKNVFLRVNLTYSIAGSGLTAVSLPLPADCPAPEIPAGFTNNSNVLYIGSGRLSSSLVAVFATNTSAFMQTNSTGTGYNLVIVNSASQSTNSAWIDISYLAQ